MMAGLSFQVCTLLVFAALALSHLVRVRRAGPGALEPATAAVRASAPFRLFVAALALALAFAAILARCVYRVAEMAGGWKSPIMQNEASFVVLDSAYVPSDPRRPSSAKTTLIERPMIASAPSRPSPSPPSTRAPASITASSTGRSCCSSGNVVGTRRRRRRRSAGAATAASQRRRKRSPATAAAAAMLSLAKRRSSHDGSKSLPARRAPREKKERKRRKREETRITERYSPPPPASHLVQQPFRIFRVPVSHEVEERKPPRSAGSGLSKRECVA